MGTARKKTSESQNPWLPTTLTEWPIARASAVRSAPASYEFVLVGNKVLTKASLPEYAHFLSNQLDETTRAITDHFQTLLSQAPFLTRWREEGINEPSMSCREAAINAARTIFDKFRLIPARIAPSVEEGIMVTYLGRSASLKVEFYNTMECAAILTLPASTPEFFDVTNIADLCHLAEKYKSAR